MEGPHSPVYATHSCESNNQGTTADIQRQCGPRKILDKQEIVHISINHNYSPDIVIRLISLFREELPQLLKCNNSLRELTVVVNSLKTDTHKVMDTFVSQEIHAEITPWPYLLVVEKKPRELDLEATTEHRAGYYMLQFETWSRFPYHKLPKWLLQAEAKMKDPPTTMKEPLKKDAVPTKSIKQDQTTAMKWPLCQTADAKIQKPKLFKLSDISRYKKQYFEYVKQIIDSIVKPNKLPICQPLIYPPQLQETEKEEKPEDCVKGQGKEWKIVKKPKPEYVRKAEIFWLIGFSLGDRIVKCLPHKGRNELGLPMVNKIWLEYKRCKRELYLYLRKQNITREFAWYHMLSYQKVIASIDFLNKNPDPRSPRFVSATVSTKPKLRPKANPEELQDCCMFCGGQGTSGMLPVLALALFKGAHVLDLSASAGHHSIFIGMMLQKTGVIVSNALIADFLPQLCANLNCFGVSSVVITHLLNDFPQDMHNKFSHVLVDAPCSGTGIIRRDERGDQQINDLKQVELCSEVQQILILRAIDCLSVEGHLVYSTSSVLVEENEAVVSYALKHRNVKLVHMNIPFGNPGLTKYRDYRFKESMKKCRRIYPHHYETEGIFLARIRKL